MLNTEEQIDTFLAELKKEILKGCVHDGHRFVEVKKTVTQESMYHEHSFEAEDSGEGYSAGKFFLNGPVKINITLSIVSGDYIKES